MSGDATVLAALNTVQVVLLAWIAAWQHRSKGD